MLRKLLSEHQQVTSDEFISPYHLEECVSRFPKDYVEPINKNSYRFAIPKTMSTPQFDRYIEIEGRLRGLEHGTQVTSTGTISPIFYAIGLFFIPWGTFIFGGFIKSWLLAFIFITSDVVVVIFVIGRRRDRLLKGILTPLKPIEYGQLKRGRQWWPFTYGKIVIPLSLNFCALRLQRLIFEWYLVEVTAINDREYQFTVIGIGTQGIGKLIYQDDDETSITYKVSVNSAGYIMPVFLLLLFAALSVADNTWLIIMPIVVTVFPLFFFISFLMSLYSLRRKINNTLYPYKQKL